MTSMSVPSMPPDDALHRVLIAGAKTAALSPAERWSHAKVMTKHFIPLLEMSMNLPDSVYDKIYDAFKEYLLFVDDPEITRYLVEASDVTKEEPTSTRVFAIVTGIVHPDESRFYAQEVAPMR